ncbi:MAG TPA: hypothetical protein VGN59_18530 [Acidimicrobiia bacterium]
MRTGRRTHRALLVVLAVLVVAAAWISIGGQAGVTHVARAQVVHTEHGSDRINAALDAGDAAAVPVLGALRTIELRLGPLWALPGLAAALAAMCLLRRLRRSPSRPLRRVALRGSASNRAPPLARIA